MKVFYTKEFGVAITRNQAQLDKNIVTEHPIDCLGDIGAAFSSVSIGIAITGLKNKYIKGPCVNMSSSEMQQRGAVFFE